MNYDIGIYTFWNVPNYGTFLQAYAMQKLLEELNPKNDIKQIAHLNKKHYQFYYSIIPIKSMLRPGFYYKLIINLLSYPKKRKKKELFFSQYNLINHTVSMNESELRNANFNYVILGSDIIWDYSQTVFGNDSFLFGHGFQSKKKLSYAASFGTIKESEHIPDNIIKYLNDLDYISVRDEKSANIVKKCTGKNPTIVLDPTWLWDWYTDDNIIDIKLDNYIIVYGQDFHDLFIEQLIKYAKQKRLKLICLDCNDDDYKWCDLVISQKDLTPLEWVAYFKNASHVATSTFHGLTFGLNFNKPLAFSQTQFILDKCENFLKELSLYDLYTDCNYTVEEMFNHTRDYTVINQIINKKKEASLEYIEKALK